MYKFLTIFIIFLSYFSVNTLLTECYSQENEFKTVVAEQGDGIYKILRKNGYDLSTYFDSFIKLNKDKIINENELIVGESYYLPPKYNTVRTDEEFYIDSLIKSQFKSVSDNKETADSVVLKEDFVESELLYTDTIITEDAQAESEFKVVIAQQGDGIFKILRENGYEPSIYLSNFIEINNEKTLNNNELIVGESYYLPEKHIPEKSDKHYDDYIHRETDITKWELRYADTIISNKLEGAMIYLISGHGGPDPGAIAKVDGHTISEDEYAYDICMRIARNIEEHGGKVVMIIKDPNNGIRDCRILPMDTDEYCYPNLTIPLNHMQRLVQRTNAVNDLYNKNKHLKYHRALEVHLDSRSTGTNLDVFFYHHTYSIAGRKFAMNIRNTFDEKYAIHQPNRGYSGTVSDRNLYVIRRTIPPAVLVELGNIQNPRDQRRFLDYKNRQALANWITEGIIKDYKMNQ